MCAQVIGQRPGVLTLAAMNMLMLPDRQIFICDTYVNHNPDSDEIAEMTLLAAEEMRRFGLTPDCRAALALELRQLELRPRHSSCVTHARSCSSTTRR